MDHIETFIILPEYAGSRLDQILVKQYPEKTRSFFQKLLEQNLVYTFDGVSVSKNYRPLAGEKITIKFPEPAELNVVPQNIPLNIVYEDDYLIVVNKPKGMVVHPAPGNYDGTLVNALLWHCKSKLSEIGGEIRPGIVHRIDKDTSGLLVVAKTDFAHVELSKQIQKHTFDRVYQAVAYGTFHTEKGTVDLPIGRSQKDRKKMSVTNYHSRNAITHYHVIKQFRKFAHLSLQLETGRTHQIRVHMAYLGHPLAGDIAYGPRNCISELKGQCLHAKTIGFIHPYTKKHMHFNSELPEYFQRFLKKCESYL